MKPINTIKTTINRLKPEGKWKNVAIVIAASFVGLGFYVFNISGASSYLSDDPKACVNCHIMTPQYVTWNHSSHRDVATCNGCHVPHDNIFNQYFFKAKDGLYHSAIFTLRAEPQVIHALKASQDVIQGNCVRCHQDQVVDAKMAEFVDNLHTKRTDRTCWDCHREVPHGRVKGIASIGTQPEPIPMHTPVGRTIVPQWLQNSLSKDKK